MSRTNKMQQKAKATAAAKNSSNKGRDKHFGNIEGGSRIPRSPECQPAPVWQRARNTSTKHWWNRGLPYKGAGASAAS